MRPIGSLDSEKTLVGSKEMNALEISEARLTQKVSPTEMTPLSISTLLKNFQDMFKVDSTWIQELSSSLADANSKVLLIFVDLDNVPKFFDHLTPGMIDGLAYETFIVCSANSARRVSCNSTGKVHFSLANYTKDAADAVCTVAAAKLDSILIQCGRQADVPIAIVSDDKIFSQVAPRSPPPPHTPPPCLPPGVPCNASRLRARARRPARARFRRTPPRRIRSAARPQRQAGHAGTEPGHRAEPVRNGFIRGGFIRNGFVRSGFIRDGLSQRIHPSRIYPGKGAQTVPGPTAPAAP